MKAKGRARSVLLALLVSAGVSLPVAAKPIPAKLVKNGGEWQLLRNGKPFEIKGAGGRESLGKLKAAGGNATRTWDAEGIEDLMAEAAANDIAVVVGIWLGHERHGFDYGDEKAVAAQYERARKLILKWKDHPATLAWGIGNEMEGFGAGDSPAIWRAVNDIAVLAKKLDPNHPTMTSTADIGGERVRSINELCPAIDIHGINSYGGVTSIPERYREAGGKKPYVVTEFGPPGTWEVPANEWKVPVELTSTAKADVYRNAYEKLTSDTELNLGSFAFLWSWKVEATATWFGMFLPTGEKLAAVDAMTEAWGGKAPKNRAPVIDSLEVVGLAQVKPGDTVKVALAARDEQKLEVRWVLLNESTRFSTGGDKMALPPEAKAKITGRRDGASVQMPEEPGPYRLYAYVYDGQGAAATANVPLNVLGESKAPKDGGHPENTSY